MSQLLIGKAIHEWVESPQILAFHSALDMDVE